MKNDIIKKSILAGLGVISLTREKAEKLVDSMVKEGELSKKESAKMIRGIIDRAEKNKKEIEKQIDSSSKKALAKLNIPSRKEITELNKKIEKLNQKLKKYESRQTKK